MNEATNHAILVISLFAGWTVVLFFALGAKKVLWEYDKFPEEEKTAEPAGQIAQSQES